MYLFLLCNLYDWIIFHLLLNFSYFRILKFLKFILILFAFFKNNINFRNFRFIFLIIFIFFYILFIFILKFFLFLWNEIILRLVFILKINIAFHILFLIFKQIKIIRLLNTIIIIRHIETRGIRIIVRMIVKVQSYKLIPRINIKILKWCRLFLSLVISWITFLKLLYI